MRKRVVIERDQFGYLVIKREYKMWGWHVVAQHCIGLQDLNEWTKHGFALDNWDDNWR